MTLPKSVRIREVGAREGFQVLKQIVPTEKKVKLINLLSQTGLKEIEVTSFVRPDKVPQMADAEDVVNQITINPSVTYSAIYLNLKGFERGEALPQLNSPTWIVCATSDTFLKKNSNTSLQQVVDEVPKWLDTYARYKKPLHGLMVSTAFGCSYEGRIDPAAALKVIERVGAAVSEYGSEFKEICLADTMGWGNPEGVRRLVGMVSNKFPQAEVTLHLHDTRGTGLANVYAGLCEGVSTFDSSVGGLGGCPFAEGAAGNIVSEDLVYLMHEMGIETGVDLNRLIEASRYAEEVVGFPLPGKIMKVKYTQ